ncbi:MAG: 2Fe-2S iron-sulfur cluster-binding protein, partial [Nocardioidaceae bacterium]
MSRRLGRQPGEVIDRDTDFTFRWDGRWYPAYQGDTISSALAACGERVFSRSFKYHRPRGLLTASHLDPGCVVQIGDEPNVRGGSRPVEPGMDVRPQDVWPSLTYDVKSATDLVGRFLPAGFYYKTFMRPAWLWPAYERVLGRFAHGGVVSPPGERRPRAYDKRHAQPDVLVAGGGPAGMAAAVSAAEAGVQVMLVEEEPTLGGHLRWGDAADLAVLHELQARLDATPGVEVLTSSVVLGRYDDSWVSVLQRQPGPVDERLVKARVGCLVVAPGLIERPYVFSGNDTPGVMLSTAVRRLVNLYAVRPGARAVVLSANAEGDAAAADLARVGVDVAHVEDARHGGDIVRVRGRGSVEAAETVTGGRVDCDLVVTAVGWTAPTSLLNMAGNAPWYDSRAARFRPDPASLPADVLPTGGLMGDGTVQQLVDHGTATGRLAASRAAQERVTTPHHVAQMSAPGEPPDLGVDAHPQLFHGRTHGMVDFSEDVSSRELLSALDEGYSSVELAKRYTTATMGPTQGKLETVNVVAILAEATGRTIGETGTTTWRPPYTPVTLGALAGRPREPVQHSPMQPWHEQHGAIPLMAGSWVRPDHYGDPAGEVTAVRESVGIIDVTPIGKLDLRREPRTRAGSCT